MDPYTDEEPNADVRHPAAHKDGGLLLKDEDGLGVKALKETLSSFGKKVAKGQIHDLMCIPGPSCCHAPYSYLQALITDMSYAPRFLTPAAKSSDYIERLKLIATMYLAGQHIQPVINQARGLLNPILGETVQRYLPDGTEAYAEQTSHHPPISNFHFIGPEGLWEFNGYTEYKGWLAGLNSVRGSRVGKAVFKFHDGGLISVKEPVADVYGVLSGEKIYNYIGTLTIKDHINKIEVEIVYNPKQGLLSGLKSKIGGSSSRGKTDSVIINFYQEHITSKTKKLLFSGTGAWLGHIEFEKKIYWAIN